MLTYIGPLGDLREVRCPDSPMPSTRSRTITTRRNLAGMAIVQRAPRITRSWDWTLSGATPQELAALIEMESRPAALSPIYWYDPFATKTNMLRPSVAQPGLWNDDPYFDPNGGGVRLSGESGTYASTPDNAALDITGDIDLRVDLTADSWSSGASQNLISKFRTSSDNRSYRLFINNNGYLALNWSTSGAPGAPSILVLSTARPVPDPLTGRLAVRATLDVNFGGTSHVVMFYTAPTISGSWTQLGATVTLSGVTSIFSSNAILEIGSVADGVSEMFSGIIHAAEVRNGIAGTVVANPSFVSQPVSSTGFTDSSGRVWTLNGEAQIVETGGALTYTMTSTQTQIDVPSGRFALTPVIPVIVGRTYTAAGVASATSTVGLRWVNSLGVTVSDNLSSSGTGRRIVTAAAPVGAVGVRVMLTPSTSGNFSKVQLTETPAAIDWLPGEGIPQVALAGYNLEMQAVWDDIYGVEVRSNYSLTLTEVG